MNSSHLDVAHGRPGLEIAASGTRTGELGRMHLALKPSGGTAIFVV